MERDPLHVIVQHQPRGGEHLTEHLDVDAMLRGRRGEAGGASEKGWGDVPVPAVQESVSKPTNAQCPVDEQCQQP